MSEYIYYPGCSLKTSGRHYDESIITVFKELGIELKELDDWNCCGATASPSVDEAKTSAITGRVLALAEKSGKDILAPCAACYMSLKKSKKFLENGSQKAEKILKALEDAGLPYKANVNVKHPVEILTKEIGMGKIKAKVIRNLNNIKIVNYYGCQIVRPFTEFDDPDYPTQMDDLMDALGLDVVDYSAKTKCCGGALTANLEEPGLRLNYILLKEAKRKGADAIVTLCPLCLFNLEITQRKITKKYKEEVKIPVFFFSQLMGLSMGIPKEDLGFSRSMIPLKKFWEKVENGGSK
ncbi:MAG: CoB--CoM heterodisulfide reductase iron-sulfur subunit B family protein [Candidatus Aminicenantes bacterium]|nr:CoB--CoM heterodisulfide reductase iron-sulfur subunit B family protein [Candidatus Aminicenantes bacterium]